MKFLSGLFLIGFAIPSMAQTAEKVAIKQAENLSYDEFYQYMSLFADDSMGGRDVASQGIKSSAAFIVEKLEEFGVQPAGENNGYYQPVPLIKTNVIKGKDEIKYIQNGESVDFIYGENITMFPYTDATQINQNMDLVYAGDGIVIPERGINAYEGLDVKGKVVIVQPTTPKAYKKDSLLRANSGLQNRIESAKQAGVAGVMLYVPIKLAETPIFNSLHGQLATDYWTINADSVQAQVFDIGLDFISLAKSDQVKAMLAQNGKKYRKVRKAVKRGEFQSFELPGDFQLKYESEQPDMTCNNIVGLLPGSDPELKDEYVVVTAHLDHVGIGKAVKGDSIYNGAWDNASGSSTVLALAHAFSELPTAPKRSVLFIWFTAEEKGLLGSNYFVTHPTVAKERLVACVNNDMTGNLFDSDEFIAMGYDMSNISEAVYFAGEHTGMRLDPADGVTGRYFKHSDHYSFVQEGIPGIFFWGGLKPVGEEKRSEKVYLKWEKKHLHKPSDDLNQEFCKEAMVKGMKLAFLATWYLANEMDEIGWNLDNWRYQEYVGEKE
ncbi:MAG: M28 family peptidase [Bacteroidales bacterium]|nr:M28 family peptidase [Bacteroidales bacterium]